MRLGTQSVVVTNLVNGCAMRFHPAFSDIMRSSELAVGITEACTVLPSFSYTILEHDSKLSHRLIVV
jgi:hypothetical protein